MISSKHRNNSKIFFIKPPTDALNQTLVRWLRTLLFRRPQPLALWHGVHFNNDFVKLEPLPLLLLSDGISHFPDVPPDSRSPGGILLGQFCNSLSLHLVIFLPMTLCPNLLGKPPPFASITLVVEPRVSAQLPSIKNGHEESRCSHFNKGHKHFLSNSLVNEKKNAVSFSEGEKTEFHQLQFWSSNPFQMKNPPLHS